MTLLITPTIQTLINDKNLSHYSFIDNGEDSRLYEKSSSNLFVTFDGCAFEGFSFKETHFLNFHFKEVYFKNCDFTNVSFAKNISFENIYLDELSAESFVKGLDDSYNKYDLKVTGIATLHIVGNLKLKTLSPKFTALLNEASYMEMPSTEEEAPMTPQKQQEVQSLGATLTSGLITMINPLSKIKTVGSATLNIASGIATTILHPIETAKTMGNAGIEVVSGLAHPLETATKIKKKEESFASHYSSYNSKENNQTDEKQCEEIKPELEKIKAQLNAEIERLKKDLSLISSSASKEYQELEKKILEQEKALKLIQPCIAELNAKHLKTKEIHHEQEELLTGPLKHYYQTLLTGLCTVLNSIALLNNDYANLIQSAAGKANRLSNKTSKNMANSEEKRLKRLERKLRNAMDLLLEPSELLIPISENIPDVPGIVPSVVQKLVYLSDQAKLKNTQNVFRGLTPKKLEKLSDEMARTFSFCYEQQILLLSEKGAKRFAENAVQCIASALLNGLIPEDEDMPLNPFAS